MLEEGMPTLTLDTPTRRAAIVQQLKRADLSAKDPDTTFIIELLAGIFGFLGVGYMYTGMTGAGVVRLIGNWIYIALIWIGFTIFSAITLGFGACLFFVPMILQVALPILSAYELREAMKAAKSQGFSPSHQGATGGYLYGDHEELPVVPPASSAPATPQERDSEL